MAKVKGIPDGYHAVTAGLVVRDAAKAIDFYKKAFGAVELMRMDGPGGMITHAELRIGDTMIMLNDEMPQCKSPVAYGGTPVGFYFYMEDVEAGLKRAVDAGAKIKMPLMDMFWGDRMGQVEDPFGHLWTLAQRTKILTPEEMKKGQQEFYAKMKK